MAATYHTSLVTKNSYSNSAGSNNDDGGELRRAYVHPLSQVVLEYLQDYRHDWIVAKGLDRSLTLHRDGSFEAKFIPLPRPKLIAPSSIASGNASVPNNSVGSTMAEGATSGTDDNSTMANDYYHHIRVWTSYDEKEKKHWLTVRKGVFRQRFLLQDNLLTAWQSNRGPSIAERIQMAVEEMIKAVDRLDHSATIQHEWQLKGQRRFRKR